MSITWAMTIPINIASGRYKSQTRCDPRQPHVNPHDCEQSEQQIGLLMHQKQNKGSNHTNRNKSKQRKNRSAESVLEGSLDQGRRVQRSDVLSPVLSWSESHIPKQQTPTDGRLPVPSHLEAGSGRIRLSPCEMPPPNHRPSFPGPVGF